MALSSTRARDSTPTRPSRRVKGAPERAMGAMSPRTSGRKFAKVLRWPVRSAQMAGATARRMLSKRRGTAQSIVLRACAPSGPCASSTASSSTRFADRRGVKRALVGPSQVAPRAPASGKWRQVSIIPPTSTPSSQRCAAGPSPSATTSHGALAGMDAAGPSPSATALHDSSRSSSARTCSSPSATCSSTAAARGVAPPRCQVSASSSPSTRVSSVFPLRAPATPSRQASATSRVTSPTEAGPSREQKGLG